MKFTRREKVMCMEPEDEKQIDFLKREFGECKFRLIKARLVTEPSVMLKLELDEKA